MIKVVISGYGRMGHMVEEVHKEIARECVCIDFTTPDAFRTNYPVLAKSFKAVVVGTTGWNDIKDEVIGCFESNGTPMIYSSNYSLGVNVLSAAVGLVARYLGKAGGYSPYIVEKHHIHKLDAPSGTAKSLAEVVEEEMSLKPNVASVRVGEVAGIHTVGFEGIGDKVIEVSGKVHMAIMSANMMSESFVVDHDKLQVTLESLHEYVFKEGGK